MTVTNLAGKDVKRRTRIKPVNVVKDQPIIIIKLYDCMMNLAISKIYLHFELKIWRWMICDHLQWKWAQLHRQIGVEHSIESQTAFLDWFKMRSTFRISCLRVNTSKWLVDDRQDDLNTYRNDGGDKPNRPEPQQQQKDRRKQVIKKKKKTDRGQAVAQYQLEHTYTRTAMPD